MCWTWIKGLFGCTPVPHPEEKPDYSATTGSVDIRSVVTRWYQEWDVPLEELWFWDGVEVKLSCRYSNPACTWVETREMLVRPEWANPGVIAHEMGHISYSLLSKAEKEGFKSAYNSVLNKDPMMVALHRQNTYMDTNIMEAHAEVYRYLGGKMPEILKRYYPKLF